MSSYEFWDELGKIFNAVVAYQEKNIEFNKRFISPWIRLGNVFEKQDRNKEAISAYERAIEMDGANPQNWFELGNIHFKMENYGEAVSAFKHAIELDAEFGLAYSNLALTLATSGETEQAVPLYQKAIELVQDAQDKAVAWNRLGNAYRKLNQYEQALEAFHKADELDRDNGGFRDSLDEVTEGPTVVQSAPEGAAEEVEPVNVSPIELIVAESRADEAAAKPVEEEKAPTVAESVIEAAENAAIEILTEIEVPVEELEAAKAAEVTPEATAEASAPEAPIAEPAPEAAVEPAAVEPAVVQPAAEAAAPQTDAAPVSEVQAEATAEAPAEVNAEPVAEAPAAAPEAVEPAAAAPGAVEAVPAAGAQETVTVVVQDGTETFTETLPVAATSTETTDANLTTEAKEEAPVEEAAQTTEVVTSEAAEAAEVAEASEPATAEEAAEAAEPELPAVTLADTFPIAAVQPAPEDEAVELGATEDPAPNSLADQLLEAEPAVLDVAQHVAYEEYLKDTSDPMQEPVEGEKAEPEAEAPGSPEPVATIDSSGDLQIEMDTKNAHVWNELGNVYFNTSAFDDAIVAYSKAIELDRWFAWPYSNLALAYVQKRRFVEAILLYQRSIELFSSDKDKAISWNRLGNVYRRLNDYENAIAAYQRADALDPDNSTLSLQSRFSLLGNYAMEQKPSYVS